MWHTTTGKIIYDPYRGAMKRKTAWWCVLEVDPEITRYYRWWIERELHIHSLAPPSWDAHVSVIRGEEPKDELKHLWKKYHKMELEIEYEHNPQVAKKEEFWFVEVKAPFLSNIRKEFDRPHDWPLHLTVGKEKY